MTNDLTSAPALVWSLAALGNAGTGGGGQTQSPYEYALSIGYTGTKEEFDKAFLDALTPYTGIDGGKLDQTLPNTLDGGVLDEKF